MSPLGLLAGSPAYTCTCIITVKTHIFALRAYSHVSILVKDHIHIIFFPMDPQYVIKLLGGCIRGAPSKAIRHPIPLTRSRRTHGNPPRTSDTEYNMIAMAVVESLRFFRTPTKVETLRRRRILLVQDVRCSSYSFRHQLCAYRA